MQNDMGTARRAPLKAVLFELRRGCVEEGQVYRNKLPLSLSFQPGPLYSILYMDSSDDLSQNTSKTPQGVTQALPDLSALLI